MDTYVITGPLCSKCTIVKKHLNALNYSFTEIDVESLEGQEFFKKYPDLSRAIRSLPWIIQIYNGSIENAIEGAPTIEQLSAWLRH